MVVAFTRFVIQYKVNAFPIRVVFAAMHTGWLLICCPPNHTTFVPKHRLLACLIDCWLIVMYDYVGSMEKSILFPFSHLVAPYYY